MLAIVLLHPSWRYEVLEPSSDKDPYSIALCPARKLRNQKSSCTYDVLFNDCLHIADTVNNSLIRDEKYFERLRGLGMTLEDEEKLIHMREYIFKVSKVKMR